jgi:hypothetical protein
MDRVRVLRVVEYEGPKEWVEATLARSILGTYECGEKHGQKCIIRAATIGAYPEILRQEGKGEPGCSS